MPSERRVSWEEFFAWLAGVEPGRVIDEIIVHHTEAPTAAQYRGIETVAAVRRFHMEERGWSDCGYNIMIGTPPHPSPRLGEGEGGGEIFLCRPLEREGAHCLGHNQRSVGIAYIANFDVEDPAQYAGLKTGQRVVAALLRKFSLPPEAIHFHREFAEKSCPGLRLGLEEYRRGVEDTPPYPPL